MMMHLVCITADCRVLRDEDADIYRTFEAVSLAHAFLTTQYIMRSRRFGNKLKTRTHQMIRDIFAYQGGACHTRTM